MGSLHPLVQCSHNCVFKHVINQIYCLYQFNPIRKHSKELYQVQCNFKKRSGQVNLCFGTWNHQIVDAGEWIKSKNGPDKRNEINTDWAGSRYILTHIFYTVLHWQALQTSHCCIFKGFCLNKQVLQSILISENSELSKRHFCSTLNNFRGWLWCILPCCHHLVILIIYHYNNHITFSPQHPEKKAKHKQWIPLGHFLQISPQKDVRRVFLYQLELFFV